MTRVAPQPFAFILGIALTLILTACNTPITDPPPPGVDTGSLQVTVVGLPTNVDAAVAVTGPENYQKTVTRSQTLQLPTGSYTVSIASITDAGITYAGKLDVEKVDVALSQTAAVTAPAPFSGTFQLRVYAAGGSEPLKTSPEYQANYPIDDFAFVPDTDGDYELRLVGLRGVIRPLAKVTPQGQR